MYNVCRLPSSFPGARLTTSTATPAARPAPLDAPLRVRLDSVDLLRGIVMVVMALDHARDFFHAGSRLGDPELLADPGLALFLTRWVTHFCAPVFVFLAGTGSFLSLANGRSPRSLSWFLVTRGLWLILLELTVVKFGWTFSVAPDFFFVQIIWVLGVSMICLAALVHLPLGVVAAIGAALVLGHNAFDAAVAGATNPADVIGGGGAGGVAAPSALSGAGLGMLLHNPGMVSVAGVPVLVRYPLIPWIGVMALGFCFGTLLLRPERERRRTLLVLGLALVAAFVALRLANVYGDPRPWAPGATPSATVIAFLNTQKYPASLLFLLMTIGPAIALLPLLERVRGPVGRFFVTFGRVPLFFYLLHVPTLRLLAGVVAVAVFDRAALAGNGPPEGWGWGLPVVYLAWVAVVLALYPLCRWFAGVKARSRAPWLSYL